MFAFFIISYCYLHRIPQAEWAFGETKLVYCSLRTITTRRWRRIKTSRGISEKRSSVLHDHCRKRPICRNTRCARAVQRSLQNKLQASVKCTSYDLFFEPQRCGCFAHTPLKETAAHARQCSHGNCAQRIEGLAGEL